MRPPRSLPLTLPLLLVLALAAYLIPPRQPDRAAQAPAPTTSTRLPSTLPEQAERLFRAARPGTVRLDSVNTRTQTGGLGTAFFISEQGDLLTAYHVVESGQLFQITALDGTAYPVRVVAFDESADVALLRAERGAPFPYLDLATQPPSVGQEVLAIGNSRGDFLQPRRGQLLALGAEASSSDFPGGTLEMNAPLAPGDSGGPILSPGGQVIGVVSYVRIGGDGQTKTSYAVPVLTKTPLMNDLRAGKKLLSPLSSLVGLAFDEMHSGATTPPGAVILRVNPGSAAARAGLRGCTRNKDGQLTGLGDTILSIGGVRTPNTGTALDQVKKLKVGDQVVVEYQRGDTKGQTTLNISKQGNVKIPEEPCTRG